MNDNRTDIITYNLRDRGREHRGTPRQFDIPRLVSNINSPAMQEQVKNRDLLGYYGHWPRQKFGMRPHEGGIQNGRSYLIEPALTTVLLEADNDGTIRHQAEFLTEFEGGQIAKRLHKSRAGGFSSAIDTNKGRFYGFDYVLEPNFSTNRGYALDSIDELTDEEVLDAIRDDQVRGLMLCLDSANDREEFAQQALEALQRENEELLDLLARNPGHTLDSVQPVSPLLIDSDPTRQFLLDSASFDDVPLPGINTPSQPEAKKPKARLLSPALRRMVSRG